MFSRKPITILLLVACVICYPFSSLADEVLSDVSPDASVPMAEELTRDDSGITMASTKYEEIESIYVESPAEEAQEFSLDETIGLSQEAFFEDAIASEDSTGEDASLSIVEKSADDFVIEDGVVIGYNGSDDDIVIPEGVVGIGQEAFRNCTALKRVTLPEGLTYIDNMGFYSQGKLEEIVFPSTLKSIGSYAFGNCSALKDLELPYGLEHIGTCCFDKCYALSSIDIPDSVTEIGNSAFLNCIGLVRARLSAGAKAVGVLVFQNCYALKEAILPEGIDRIPSGFFNRCESLERIDIPSGVTYIGDSAFLGCSALQSVTLPNGLERIEFEAFSRCTQLKDVALPSTLKYIGKRTFSGCAISEIDLPAGITIIPEAAFSGCINLSKFSMHSGVREIGRSAFLGCTMLTNLEIPNTVTKIGDEAFKGIAFKRVIVPSSVVEIGQQAFSDLATVFAEPGSVAWKYCEEHYIELLPIGSEDFSIKGGVLLRYMGTDDIVTIPDGVTSIGENAFSNNAFIKRIVLHGGITAIGEWAFSKCVNLSKINLPESITSIGMGAFNECIRLKEIRLPSQLKTLSKQVLAGSGIEAIEIPEGIKAIQGFDNCMQLKVVKFPKSALSIEQYAFQNCSSLASIDLPDALNKIGEGAFLGCSALKSIDIPENVTIDGDYTFYNCSALQTVVLREGVFKDNSCTFKGCTSLKSVEIRGAIPNIGAYDFQGCVSLKSVILADGIAHIGLYAFQGCTALEEIRLPGSVDEIQKYAFADCTSLKRVAMRQGVSSTLRQFSFANCTALAVMELPPSLSKIEKEAFVGAGHWTGYVTTNTMAYQYCVAHDYPYVLVDPQEMEIYADGKRVEDVVRLDLSKGSTVSLTLRILPESAAQGGYWSISNEKVARINSDTGLVTGLKKGEATITVQSADRLLKREFRLIVGRFVQSIQLSGSNTLSIGKTTKIKVTVFPKKVDNNKLQWSSSNTKIATVNNKGVVKASKNLTKHETVMITATATDGSGIHAEWIMDIYPVTKSISIFGDTETKPLKTVNIDIDGGALRLLAKAIPEGASQTFEWSSSKPAIASVTDDGIVVPMRAGKTTVTAKAKDGSKKTAKVTVVVSKLVRRLEIEGSDVVASGKSITLKAVVDPENASDKGVIWTSSDTKIATVSSKGIIKGSKKLNEVKTVVITATARDGGGATANKIITVVPATNKVTLMLNGESAPKELTVRPGDPQVFKLTASISPESAHQEVTWESNKPKVAIVENGQVVIVGKGKATITATSVDGSKKKDTIKIIVK